MHFLDVCSEHRIDIILFFFRRRYLALTYLVEVEILKRKLMEIVGMKLSEKQSEGVNYFIHFFSYLFDHVIEEHH